jgi:hypothetical protein
MRQLRGALGVIAVLALVGCGSDSPAFDCRVERYCPAAGMCGADGVCWGTQPVLRAICALPCDNCLEGPPPPEPAPANAGAATCAARCERHEDCPSGERCIVSGLCEPAARCSAGKPCAKGLACTADGYCTSTNACEDDSHCPRNTVCGGGVCILPNAVAIDRDDWC